jgi:hypothetical protein
LSLAIPSLGVAQDTQSSESTSRYSIQIDMSQAYVGGICIIKGNGSSLNVSIVNEFGISMMTFRYEYEKGKIKMLNCIKQFNKPYIKKALKKDFKIILREYLTQNTQRLPIQHNNFKYNITYNLIPL